MHTPLGLLLVLLLASACRGPGDDVIYGTYAGYLREADLDRGITVEEENSSFVLVLEAGDGGVAGQATLRGKTHGPLGTFDGKEVTEIPDVHISGEDLWCTYERAGFGLSVTGEFGRDFTELDLDVEFVGVLFLELQLDQ
ncbi:MAG: hypothetical protein Q8P18_05270 [Pseudomonadota bacterium]|nr:hypothetical protein [Pseudomonadota bacterium]